MANASSGSCITDAKIQVSYDSLSGSATTWVDLPAMQKVTKSYSETQANKTRHSASGTKFVTPCGTSTRTEQYSVQMLFCNDDPLSWYLKDGDERWFKIIKGSAGDAALYTEIFKAKYVDGGYTWDNTTEDGEEVTFTLEATGTVARTHKAASPTESKYWGVGNMTHNPGT